MKKKLLQTILTFIIIGLTLTPPVFPAVNALSQSNNVPHQTSPSPEASPEINPSKINITYPNIDNQQNSLSNETPVEVLIINGPPTPPVEFQEERLASIKQLPSRGIISDFPSYDWVFGCSAVSAAMIAAYYDRNGYSNIYTGPTNGGVMPITDASWTTWLDVELEEYPNNPLVASHNGVDGRLSNGSIDNYWVSYDSFEDDPFITNGWEEHDWGTAIGDFMKTSQSTYGNLDGQTRFWFHLDFSKYTCTEMETAEATSIDGYVSDYDGTYGRKLFYEARGYTVNDCYSQMTDNTPDNEFDLGFTLEDFQTEIDRGFPVLLNMENAAGGGHSIVGFGYDDDTIFIRDTWDSNPENIYSFTWGESYSGYTLHSVSVVHMDPPPPPSAPNILASDGAYTDKVVISWLPSDGAYFYEVYRNTSDSIAGASWIAASLVSSPFADNNASPGTLYYYWMRGCNSFSGCSDFSPFDTGYRKFLPPSGVIATDGAFTDKVQISWDGVSGATFYQIFRNTSDSHSGETDLGTSSTTSFDDTTAVLGTSYYYWVKACNSLVCSDYSLYDRGYVTSEVTPPSAPSSISASDGTYTDKVLIDWPPVIGASRYIVLRGEDNKPGDAKVLVNDLTISSYDDVSATPAFTYYYWVIACNGGGCSDYSKPDTGWRDKIPIVYPSYLPFITTGGSLSVNVTNGEFEQGPVGWTEYSTHGYNLIIMDTETYVTAHTGDWLVWLGGDFEDTSYISQNITIPSETPYLHFWYWIDSNDACGYDFFRVKIDSVAVQTKNLCSSQNTGGWVEEVLNLSPYLGSDKLLSFEVTTDSILNSNFFLDDVSLSGTESVAGGGVKSEAVNLETITRARLK